MINREVMLQILSQMPDEALMKALSVNGLKVANEMEDPTMAAMALDDPNNKIQPWGERKIKQKPDSRPTLTDKKYLEVEQNAQVPVGGAMPADGGYDPYGFDPGSGT